ncbi:mechanosensitive ion channel domain-containing protein [Leptolyngbya sp. CCNP1308]|uniref:mechanosensitive ion channel family protein n=1 Tax=Leptolyngbya sp. CCNP1308 TaxID=3110255 RepID=UPI002B208DC6|nr:mechanosensitive ion channel domain-containing protein [Leptolyngbya sp. CCNP1308]MEA5451101.1 mechanosensitive ion channel domain-containing protein [Leptolyngbya sp. CCNP1308]
MENWTQWVATAQELVTRLGLNLIAALVIFWLGQWIAKLAARTARRLMARQNIDPILVNFTGSLIYYSGLAFVVIAALNRLGVQTASLIAVLGAAGLAIGLALQGSLSNFAAGVLMLIFRPFRVGDFIEGGGTLGTVESIQLFTTTIVTPENAAVIVPNSKLGGDNITNFTARPIRRVETLVGISYGDNIEQARRAILDEIASDRRILTDPAPSVSVIELADSSVNLQVWVWANTPDFLAVKLALPEAIKTRLDAEEISIPFPQQEVYMFQKN